MTTETLVKCEFCNAEFDEDEMRTTPDGESICDDCYCDSDYSPCCWCGEIHHGDDLNWIDEDYYCDDCARKNFVRCERCDEYIKTEDDHGDCSITLCHDCYCNYYYTCDDCGSVTHQDYINHSGDYCYCDDCIGNHEKIKSYGYTPDINFLKNKKQSTKLHFGFELEVAGNEDCAEDYLEFFKDDEREIFLTHDSSIEGGQGFEITSQPMTYSYFKNTLENKFKDSLEFLQRHGFESHNKGGLHVHTSREAWSNGQLAQLSLIMYGDDNDIDTWLKITQRKRKALEDWASMKTYRRDFDEVLNGYEITSTRYTAVRYTCDTIEFRIFNGNLRIERFLKNIECVKALYDYTKTLEKFKTPVATTEKFLRYVFSNSRKYKNLYNFIVEREIYQAHRQNASVDTVKAIAA